MHASLRPCFCHHVVDGILVLDIAGMDVKGGPGAGCGREVKPGYGVTGLLEVVDRMPTDKSIGACNEHTRIREGRLSSAPGRHPPSCPPARRNPRWASNPKSGAPWSCRPADDPLRPGG